MKTINFNIIIFVANLITFENEKDITFKFNDLVFRTLDSIVQKDNKIFIFIVTARRNKIADVVINQFALSAIKTNMKFIKNIFVFFDCASRIKFFINNYFNEIQVFE